ncbi:MAG: YeeE/YedE thiosulfate transporter family protein [Acidiferrobacterales bacterium]
MTRPSHVGQHLIYGLLGLALGFSLSRMGFANYGQVHRMFVFSDLRLLYTFAGAVALTMIGFQILARGQNIPRKPFHPGTIPGSILFGTGWALTGSCPAIAIVQLGEGQLAAAFTLLGILFGVWVYRQAHAQYFHWDRGACE